MIQFVFALCLLSIFVFIKRYKNADCYEYNIDTTLFQRGVFSLLIVLHHLACVTIVGDTSLSFLKAWGGPIVGFFFFTSGYGLCNSLKAKGRYYLKNFFGRKLSKLLYPIIIVLTLYFLFKLSILDFDFSLLLACWSRAELIPFGWFITELFLFYIIFYSSAALSNDIRTSCRLIWLCSVLLAACLFIINAPGVWLRNIFCFAIGYTVCLHPDFYMVRGNLSKYNNFIICIVVIAVDALILLLDRTADGGGILVASHVLPLQFYIITRKLPMPNKGVITSVGKISYELYLIHGVVIYIVSVYVKSSCILLLLVCMMTVLLSLLISFIDKWIPYLISDIKKRKM